ncbi:MAG: hypothetical protein JWO93_455 [Micrococcaceae bacterium]|nr:hypothetical protein [Micrococcaceae bacterium]
MRPVIRQGPVHAVEDCHQDPVRALVALEIAAHRVDVVLKGNGLETCRVIVRAAGAGTCLAGGGCANRGTACLRSGTGQVDPKGGSHGFAFQREAHQAAGWPKAQRMRNVAENVLASADCQPLVPCHGYTLVPSQGPGRWSALKVHEDVRWVPVQDHSALPGRGYRSRGRGAGCGRRVAAAGGAGPIPAVLGRSSRGYGSRPGTARGGASGPPAPPATEAQRCRRRPSPVALPAC